MRNLIQLMLISVIFLVGVSRSAFPQDYKVQKGDTLSAISERFLKDSSRWREILNHPKNIKITKPESLAINEILWIPIPQSEQNNLVSVNSKNTNTHSKAFTYYSSKTTGKIIISDGDNMLITKIMKSKQPKAQSSLGTNISIDSSLIKNFQLKSNNR